MGDCAEAVGWRKDKNRNTTETRAASTTRSRASTKRKQLTIAKDRRDPKESKPSAAKNNLVAADVRRLKLYLPHFGWSLLTSAATVHGPDAPP